MSSFKFNRPEFKHFVHQIIEGGGNQRLRRKFRRLSKYHNSQFEQAIKYSVVNYAKLKDLATSKFARQILNLKLSAPVELHRLNDLCFISTKYFVNIQKIILHFVKSNLNNDLIQPYKRMSITNNLSIRGLSIKKNKYVRGLEIQGNHDVKIQNSKFDGLQIYAYINASVEISSVKFLNQSPHAGFFGDNCTQIIIKDIFCKNCGRAISIERCQNFFASNINLQQCKDEGFMLNRVKNFEISNAKIFECEFGLHFDHSNGKIMDVIIRKCRSHGIVLEKSRTRYDKFLCISNAGNDVKMEDDDSTFVEEL